MLRALAERLDSGGLEPKEVLGRALPSAAARRERDAPGGAAARASAGAREPVLWVGVTRVPGRRAAHALAVHTGLGARGWELREGARCVGDIVLSSAVALLRPLPLAALLPVGLRGCVLICTERAGSLLAL